MSLRSFSSPLASLLYFSSSLFAFGSVGYLAYGALLIDYCYFALLILSFFD